MVETINQRIFRCRRLLNLNQTDVAERLGIKTSTYSQMERRGKITTERLIKLAEIFGVTTEFLLYGDATSVDNEPKKNDTLFQDPQTPEKAADQFLITNKEENFLKMIRNLSKTNRDIIMQHAHSLYLEERNLKK